MKVLDIEKKYEEDSTYRTTIDNLINTSTEFNKLLGEISAQSKNLLKGFTS